MNREIKFRGKTPEGKWVYGDLKRVNDNRRGGQFYYIWVDTDDVEDQGRDVRIDRETVGQFTGLKDMNGMEIYEGDVISEYGNQYQVKFGDYQWSGCLVTGFYFSDEHPFGKCVYENTYEVIGSIHDKEKEANNG